MAIVEGKVIRNFDLLTEEYLPEDLIARQEQITQLQRYLSPALQGQKPLHVWLYGRPGTGKTGVARHAIRQLEGKSQIEVAYVNCWQHSTLFLVLQRIIELLRIVVPDNANSVVKLHRIISRLNNTPLIIVLDEIDKASPKDRNSIIYSLCQVKNIGIVAICNGIDELLSLEERVRSRFDPATICFEPYSIEDIRRILENRAKSALREKSWWPEVLDKIAELSAGDARVAILTLRNAAQHADLNAAPMITPEHVQCGWTNSRQRRIEYLLKKATNHHRLLYRIVQESGEITSGELWAAYLNICKSINQNPIANRTYNIYINTLVGYGLLTRERASVPGNVYKLRPGT